MQKSVVLVALSVLSTALWAAPQAVTLPVPGMDCPTCPITIKKALERAPGVSAVEVNLEKREAAVSFDDAKTCLAALTRATENAGYPSKPVGSEK